MHEGPRERCVALHSLVELYALSRAPRHGAHHVSSSGTVGAARTGVGWRRRPCRVPELDEEHMRRGLVASKRTQRRRVSHAVTPFTPEWSKRVA